MISAFDVHANVTARVKPFEALVHVPAIFLVFLQLVSLWTTAADATVVLFARVRTTVILGASQLRQLLAGPGILPQPPSERTLAVVRAVGVDAAVGTIVLVLALVNVLASTAAV